MCRTYLISNSHKRSGHFDDGYDFCNDRNLGLAVWKSGEAYEDIEYLSYYYANGEELYTALNNENNEECNTDNGNTDCDGKLIWRQTKCGPYEPFERDPGHVG